MESKVLFTIIGGLCLVNLIGAEPGHSHKEDHDHSHNEDCNTGVSNLLPHVDKENTTQPDCDTARHKVQELLSTCESSDPVQFVTIMLDFVKAFGKGADCHDTPGKFQECHDVPPCYKFIIGTKSNGESEYVCGENNENADAILNCLQKQIDAGCDVIGKKVKAYNQAAADKFCYKSDSSPITFSSLSLIITTVTLLLQWI